MFSIKKNKVRVCFMKLKSGFIGVRVELVICFESMHAIGHVGSQNRQI